MNADNHGIGEQFDEIHPNLSDQTRDWILNLVRQTLRQQFVTLSPQEKVQHCLQTGEPVTCTATWAQEGVRRRFLLPLARTAEGGLQIAASDWPQELQLVSAVSLAPVRFEQFSELNQEFLPVATWGNLSPEKLAAESKRLAAESNWKLSASSDGADDECDDVGDWEILWDYAKGLTLKLADEDRDEPLHAVIEVSVGSKPIWQSAVTLIEKQGASGEWTAKVRFPRPESTYNRLVSVKVRPVGDGDLDLFDHDADGGPSHLTQLLAREQFEACPWRTRGDVYQTSGMNRKRPRDAQVLLSVVQRQDEQGGPSPPFEPAAIDGLNSDAASLDVNKLLKKFRDAATAKDSAGAMHYFDLAWRNLGPELEVYIRSLIDNGDAHEEIVSNAALQVFLKFPQAEDDRFPRAYCFKTAFHCFCQDYRKRTRKTGRLLQTPDDLGIEALQKYHEASASVAVSQSDADLADLLVAKLLDRLLPAEQVYLATKYLEVDHAGKPHSDAAISELLGLTEHQSRHLADRTWWKLKVLDGLDFLGDRLSACERKFVEMSKIDCRKTRAIERELNITSDKRMRLERRALLLLHAGIAMRTLGRQQRFHDHDQEFVFKWLFTSSQSVLVNVGRVQVDIRHDLGRRLHGQILVETDHQRSRDEALGQLGRNWLEWTLQQRASAAQIEDWLRNYTKFTDPSGRFRGQVSLLKDHIQQVWEQTPTLVPPEFARWV